MYIASISGDVKIHSWPSGQLVNTYKASGHGALRTISWGKDGNWLVLVPTQGPAEIIAVRENVLRHLYTIEHVQQPTCAVFQNLTKRNIAFGTNTGNVLVYDIKTKTVRKHFPRASSTVFRIEYGMKDNFLLAACENGEILNFNSATMNCAGSFRVPSSKSVSTIRTHVSRRNLFMAGSEEGVVAVWDITRNSVLHKHSTHQAIVTDVSFSPIRHDLIVSCGLDRKFTFWDTTSRSMVLQKILDRSPTSIDFCPDGVGLAVGTQSGVVHTYDTRRMNDAMYTFKAHNTFVRQLLFQRSSMEESGDYGFSGNNQEVSDTPAGRTIDQAVVTAFDSFGSMLCDLTSPHGEACDELEVNESNHDRGSDSDIQQDSFLDAVGIVNSNSLRDQSHCGPISKGVRKLLDSKPNLLDSVNSDQSPSCSRDPRDPRRVKSNWRGEPSRNEYVQSSPREFQNEYSRGDGLSSPAQEIGDNQIRNNAGRNSRRMSNYTEEQQPYPQSSRSTNEPATQEKRTQTIYQQQNQQPPPLPALKHRQLDNLVPPIELKHESINENAQPVNAPLESVRYHSQRNSTPKVVTQSNNKTPVPVHISPIISQAPSRPTAAETLTDFNNTVRQVVKQEVKDQLETFHQSLKYDIMEVLAQIRRNFLDMQMSIVKEFVQLESILNRVREDLSNEDGLTDELLIQENIRLRKELAALREQVIRNNGNN